VGLELQIVRHLVAHPAVALEIHDADLTAFESFGVEQAERLRQLVAAAQALGPQGNFAAFALHLKEQGSEYDAIVHEISSETTASDFDAVRLYVASAIRQIKMDALKAELDQLFKSGKSAVEIGERFREISALQDQLRREAEAGLSAR